MLVVNYDDELVFVGTGTQLAPGGDAAQSRGVLHLLRLALAADWLTEPRDATARQQRPLHRAQARGDRR